MADGASSTIEMVRGRLTEDAAAEVRSLWDASGAVPAEAAETQLAGTVCLLRSGAGELEGLSWVVAGDLPLVGGRRFWIYRSVVAGEPGEQSDRLLTESFAALEREFDADARGPIGVCLMITDPGEMERRPDAQWDDPPMTYAGFTPDGAQVRVGYFAGALI